MRILTRDLAAVAGLAAAVVVSLAAVRATASAPEPTTSAPAATRDAGQWRDIAAPISTAPSPVLWPTGPGPTKTMTTQAPRQQQPVGTLVLSSGAAVNPRLDRTPRTPRSAATPTMIVAPTPPPDSPDPQVFLDPAAVATSWLSALCWYAYQDERDDNTRRATSYGDVHMPPGQDPWTLDDQAWAQITAGQTSSACTNITATVEGVPYNGIDVTTVNLTATQVLSAAGTAYGTTPVNLTRILQRDPDGQWRIGRAVTAN